MKEKDKLSNFFPQPNNLTVFEDLVRKLSPSLVSFLTLSLPSSLSLLHILQLSHSHSLPRKWSNRRSMFCRYFFLCLTVFHRFCRWHVLLFQGKNPKLCFQKNAGKWKRKKDLGLACSCLVTHICSVWIQPAFFFFFSILIKRFKLAFSHLLKNGEIFMEKKTETWRSCS